MTKCRLASCKLIVQSANLCSKHRRAKYRKDNPNSDKDYNRSPFGFLSRLYMNMKSRIKYSYLKSFKHYKGLDILPRNKFYKWAVKHPIYIKLYNEYKSNNYIKRLAPSVDRINPDKGYVLSNMEWVTYSENIRRSIITRKRFK